MSKDITRYCGINFGIQYPFITWKDAHEFICKMASQIDKDKESKMNLIENFILNGSKTAGAPVTYTTKEIYLHESDDAKCRVYAFVICDIFDKKEAVKDLKFFNTAGSINKDTASLWIAMPKSNFPVNATFLYSYTKPTETCVKIEEILNPTWVC